MKLSKIQSFFNIPPEKSTIVKIDNMLEESARITYKASPSNKPSMLGAKCLRKIYYSYFRIEEDTPQKASGIRIFRTGDAYETMVLEWLKKINEHIPYRNKSNSQIPKNFLTKEEDTQFPIKSPRWKIKKGKIDNIAVVDGELWIYEIKSMKASKFSNLNEPLAEHLIQVAIYFQTFNDLYLEGEYSHIPELKQTGKAKGVKIIYVNKDNSQMKEFQLSENALRPIILKVDKKILNINSYLDSKTLPPKTSDYCSYCSWQKKCKENWNDV